MVPASGWSLEYLCSHDNTSCFLLGQSGSQKGWASGAFSQWLRILGGVLSEGVGQENQCLDLKFSVFRFQVFDERYLACVRVYMCLCVCTCRPGMNTSSLPQSLSVLSAKKLSHRTCGSQTRLDRLKSHRDPSAAKLDQE